MTGRGGVAALAFALIAGRAAAAGDAGSETEQVQSGKSLYAQHCSHCHGFSMVNAGNVVPDLREFPRDNKQRFVDTVTHGKNNRMPPWSDVLSSAEIDELWAYIRTGGK
jgi:mono/diheme cytochrome c family protein